MGSFRVSPPTPERRLKHSTEGRLGMEEDQAQGGNQCDKMGQRPGRFGKGTKGDPNLGNRIVASDTE